MVATTTNRPWGSGGIRVGVPISAASKGGGQRAKVAGNSIIYGWTATGVSVPTTHG